MASLQRLSLLVCAALTVLASAASAQDSKPFQPVEGQAGKDVVWVPTPPAMVERMLDVAKVTPQDFVMDLGSGDGRNIIAAAKRGARAVGVEFNQEMVDLSKKLATEAGVGGAYFFTANLGIGAELDLSLFYGAATIERAVTAIPVASLAIGAFFDWEHLP